MDGWGIGLIVVGILGYLLSKNKSGGFAKFAIFVTGFGAGLLVGAIWAYTIVDRILGL